MNRAGTSVHKCRLKRRAFAQYAFCYVVATLLFLVSPALIGNSIVEKGNTFALGILAFITVMLLARRLYPLNPAQVTHQNYADWRKAMQKPLESAVASILLFVVAILDEAARSLSPGIPEIPPAVRGGLVALFAWQTIAPLAGSAGADACAWIEKVEVREVWHIRTTSVAIALTMLMSYVAASLSGDTAEVAAFIGACIVGIFVMRTVPSGVRGGVVVSPNTIAYEYGLVVAAGVALVLFFLGYSRYVVALTIVFVMALIAGTMESMIVYFRGDSDRPVTKLEWTAIGALVVFVSFSFMMNDLGSGSSNNSPSSVSPFSLKCQPDESKSPARQSGDESTQYFVCSKR